jgi:hypothetical protein
MSCCYGKPDVSDPVTNKSTLMSPILPPISLRALITRSSTYKDYIRISIEKCVNELRWLLSDIEKYVIIITCNCGMHVGIDKLSMLDFLIISFRLIEEMNQVMFYFTQERDISGMIEKWNDKLAYYDVILLKAVLDVHLDKSRPCWSRASEFRSKVLDNRKMCINRIKTIINQIATMDTMSYVRINDEKRMTTEM